DAPLRLGRRNALHPVAAGLELELGIRALPDDADDDFLVSADVPRRLGYQLDLPALALGVARGHAEQIAGNERGLSSPPAGPDLQEDVALVVRVLRQEHLLLLRLERPH